MADLDDFFAKKGKKRKSKSSSKKISEGTDGTDERVVKELTLVEETEWKEVQDTVEISADDLKLQTLSTEESSTDNVTDTNSSSKSKTQESSKGKEQDSSKANVASPWQPLQKEKECTTPATTVTSSVLLTGSYVPPSRRVKSRTTGPLDITSESAFPSLIATTDTEKKKKKSNVSGDDEDNHHHQQMYTELHLQNKFSSLRTE